MLGNAVVAADCRLGLAKGASLPDVHDIRFRQGRVAPRGTS